MAEIRLAGPPPPAMPVAPPPVRSSAPPESNKPKLIEVDLRRKYCPIWLVREDGSVERQDNDEPTQSVRPGIVMLHPEDAKIALNTQAAVPNENTWKAMSSE